MAGYLSPVVHQQAFDLGIVAPGALLYTYLSGSSTPQPVYTTSALNVARAIPVEADITGQFPALYLANVAYRMTLTDADGATIWGPQDNISNVSSVAGSDTQVQFNDNGTLAGDSGLAYNKTTDTLSAGAAVIAANLSAGGTLAVTGITTLTALLTLLAGQIKFPATQNPASNANTFDDYEWGTWTPADASGASLVLTVSDAQSIKLGRLVLAGADITYPVTANANDAVIGGLPFTPMVSTVWGALKVLCDDASVDQITVASGAPTVTPRSSTGSNITNATLSTNRLIFAAFYRAAA